MDPSLDLNGNALPWTDDQEHLARLCAQNLTDMRHLSDWFEGRHDIHIDVDFITYAWAGKHIKFRYQEKNYYAEINDKPVGWVDKLFDEFNALADVDNYNPFRAYSIIKTHTEIIDHPEYIPIALCLVCLSFDGELQESFIQTGNGGWQDKQTSLDVCAQSMLEEMASSSSLASASASPDMGKG